MTRGLIPPGGDALAPSGGTNDGSDTSDDVPSWSELQDSIDSGSNEDSGSSSDSGGWGSSSLDTDDDAAFDRQNTGGSGGIYYLHGTASMSRQSGLDVNIKVKNTNNQKRLAGARLFVDGTRVATTQDYVPAGGQKTLHMTYGVDNLRNQAGAGDVTVAVSPKDGWQSHSKGDRITVSTVTVPSESNDVDGVDLVPGEKDVYSGELNDSGSSGSDSSTSGSDSTTSSSSGFPSIEETLGYDPSNVGPSFGAPSQDTATDNNTDPAAPTGGDRFKKPTRDVSGPTSDLSGTDPDQVGPEGFESTQQGDESGLSGTNPNKVGPEGFESTQQGDESGLSGTNPNKVGRDGFESTQQKDEGGGPNTGFTVTDKGDSPGSSGTSSPGSFAGFGKTAMVGVLGIAGAAAYYWGGA